MVSKSKRRNTAKQLTEVITLLFSDDPALIAHCAIKHLALEESWRASSGEEAVASVP